jgi:hypothetical protein
MGCRLYCDDVSPYPYEELVLLLWFPRLLVGYSRRHDAVEGMIRLMKFSIAGSIKA